MVGDYWTKYKLERIFAYLPHFTREMDAKGLKTLYVDAFAGDGVVTFKKPKRTTQWEVLKVKTQTATPGSAARALHVDPPFDRYRFNDIDSENVRKLKRLRDASAFAGRTRVRRRDANKFVLDVCEKKDWTKTRAVFVIDPYTTHFRWNSLEAIAQTKAADVWYLFPLSDIVRLLPWGGIKGENMKQRLRDVLGVEDIDHEFYRTWTEDGFFPEYNRERTTRTKDIGAIVTFVKKRFRSIFPFVAAPKSVENRTSSTMFMLFFASSIPGERTTTPFVEKLMHFPFNAPLPAEWRA